MGIDNARVDHEQYFLPRLIGRLLVEEVGEEWVGRVEKAFGKENVVRKSNAKNLLQMIH